MNDSTINIDIRDVNVYDFCDYEGKGSLIQALQSKGEKGLKREIRMLSTLMYSNGHGFRIKEIESDGISVQSSLSDSFCFTESEVRVRPVCWKLEYRGLYGESLLHILIICNSESHTRVAKCLLQRFPQLAHDIFHSSQYFGLTALHLSIAYKNTEIFDMLLQLGVNVNERASGTFFMPADQQASKQEEQRIKENSNKNRNSAIQSSRRSNGSISHRHYVPTDFSGESSVHFILSYPPSSLAGQ